MWGPMCMSHCLSMQSHFAKLVDELERGMASLLDTYRTGTLCWCLPVLRACMP